MLLTYGKRSLTITCGKGSFVRGSAYLGCWFSAGLFSGGASLMAGADFAAAGCLALPGGGWVCAGGCLTSAAGAGGLGAAGAD